MPFDDNNPLKISCKQCGSHDVGFDIIHQSYACKHCGHQAEPQHLEEKWTDISQLKSSDGNQKAEYHYCPSCGANVIFGEGEASITCDFCGGNLVRKNFSKCDRLPRIIIPFYITENEAKERLLKFAKKHKNKPECGTILSKIEQLKAYYLPYELVRGPVSGSVERDNIFRRYQCRGYLEGIAINTSKQLDNMVLNMAEPFDWSKAQPFDYGFISGHRVKLSDISPKNLQERIITEATSDFLPQVERVLQTPGVTIKLTLDNMLSMPILVPMYLIQEGKLTAVVNGQTGRVSVSIGRKKKTIPWIIEPTLYTIIFTLLASIPFDFEIGLMVMLGIVFGVIIFVAMCEGRGPITRRMMVQSKSVKAERRGEKLHITEGKNILKNPYDNTPVFIETNDEGNDVPVKIRFYTFSRIFFILFRIVACIGMPIFLAVIIRYFSIKDTDEPFLEHFNIEYGAAWYCLAVPLAIIYWVKGVRQNVYEHPVIYEILKNGKKRLIGNWRSRDIGFLSMFEVGKYAKSSFEYIREIFNFVTEFKLAVAFILFLLLGTSFVIQSPEQDTYTSDITQSSTTDVQKDVKKDSNNTKSFDQSTNTSANKVETKSNEENTVQKMTSLMKTDVFQQCQRVMDQLRYEYEIKHTKNIDAINANFWVDGPEGPIQGGSFWIHVTDVFIGFYFRLILDDNKISEDKQNEAVDLIVKINNNSWQNLYGKLNMDMENGILYYGRAIRIDNITKLNDEIILQNIKWAISYFKNLPKQNLPEWNQLMQLMNNSKESKTDDNKTE